MYFCIEKWGFLGAPLAQALGAWLLLLLYVLYFGCTGLHKRCWEGWTAEALRDWGPLAKMGAAGTASMMGAHSPVILQQCRTRACSPT